MKSAIRLERDVAVETWRIAGSMSRAVKRDWELAVLRLAARKGAVTEADVAGELLNGRRPVAARLLGILANLKTLDKAESGYTITESGRKAVASGTIFVPERGTWTLFVSTDPLLPSPLILAEEYKEPSASSDLRPRTPEGSSKPVMRTFQPTPSLVRGLIGKDLPVVVGGPVIRIEDVEQKSEPIASASVLTVVAEVTSEGVRTSIKGKVGQREVSCEVSPPTIAHDHLWQALLDDASVGARWESSRQVFLVRFEEATERELASMQRTFRFAKPDLPAWGEFKPVEVADVPLSPLSGEDALLWAKWRLSRSIVDYATPEAFEKWQIAAVAPFIGVDTSGLPGRSELAREARESARSHGGDGRPDSTYWHLQAPLDWAL